MIKTNTPNYGRPKTYINVGTERPYVEQYSLARVQLINGEVIGINITASPSLGAHLTKQLGSDGYINLFNDVESLIIKADQVVAVHLTLLTKGQQDGV